MTTSTARYRTLNAAWQLPHTAELIEDCAETFRGGADVLLVVEARTGKNTPVPVGKILARKRWTVIQNVSDAAHAGSALAVRRDGPAQLLRARTFLLAAAGRAETAVQARYMIAGQLLDEGVHTTVGDAHLPLATSGMQEHGVACLGRWVDRQPAGSRWLLGGDFNMGADVLAHRLAAAGHDVHPADADGAHPMGLIWSPTGWDHPHVEKQSHPWTDHDVLTLTTKEHQS